MLGVFVGRQPIYDNKLQVVGYEMLFHQYDAGQAEFVEYDYVSSRVMMNTFVEVGVERLVGNGLAFVHFDRSMFEDGKQSSAKYPRIVAVIKDNESSDKNVLKTANELSKLGYQIALDDVSDTKLNRSFLKHIDFVRLNVHGIEADELQEYVSAVKKLSVKTVAQNIETLDMYDKCRELGFDYFHGLFLSRPNIASGSKLPASRLAILRLLAKLHEPDIEFSDLDEIVQNDVALSYRILRVINSVFYTKTKKIESIHQALVLLGIKRIKDWVSMLALSKAADKPQDLVLTALERAKMCELIALREYHKETGFIIGLFSLIDALLDMPLEEIVSSLPLSDEIQAALINHEGKLGEVLECAIAYQQGKWEIALDTGLNPDIVREAFLESLDWSVTVSSLL